ncbi:MAG: hypothetical protein ACI9QV_000096, partial [Methylophagaceae bacterium]
AFLCLSFTNSTLLKLTTSDWQVIQLQVRT